MRSPPWLARVQVQSVTLWIPLLLLWPLLLLALVFGFVAGAVAALVLEGIRFAPFLELSGGFWRLLCELPGTRISVEAGRARIAVTLY